MTKRIVTAAVLLVAVAVISWGVKGIRGWWDQRQVADALMQDPSGAYCDASNMLDDAINVQLIARQEPPVRVTFGLTEASNCHQAGVWRGNELMSSFDLPEGTSVPSWVGATEGATPFSSIYMVSKGNAIYAFSIDSEYQLHLSWKRISPSLGFASLIYGDVECKNAGPEDDCQNYAALLGSVLFIPGKLSPPNPLHKSPWLQESAAQIAKYRMVSSLARIDTSTGRTVGRVSCPHGGYIDNLGSDDGVVSFHCQRPSSDGQDDAAQAYEVDATGSIRGPL